LRADLPSNSFPGCFVARLSKHSIKRIMDSSVSFFSWKIIFDEVGSK